MPTMFLSVQVQGRGGTRTEILSLVSSRKHYPLSALYLALTLPPKMFSQSGRMNHER